MRWNNRSFSKSLTCLESSYRKGLATEYEGGREVADFVQFAKLITGFVFLLSSIAITGFLNPLIDDLLFYDF